MKRVMRANERNKKREGKKPRRLKKKETREID